MSFLSASDPGSSARCALTRVQTLSKAALCIGLLLLPAATTDAATCKREDSESFVQAAYRCVGWLQDPSEQDRSAAAPGADKVRNVPLRTSTGPVDVGFPIAGVGQAANELFSLIVEIAVDRAKRQGLALVHDKIQDGVCHFPAPKGFPVPLLPSTCSLIQTTDLQTLVGQSRGLRASLTTDVVQIASFQIENELGNVLPLRNAATAALAVVQRFASQPAPVLTKNDVWLVANAFLNSPWRARQLDSAGYPDLTSGQPQVISIANPNKALITLEVAVASARVYVEAQQLKADEQTVATEAANAATDARAAAPPSAPPAAPPAPPPAALREVIDLAQVIDLEKTNCTKIFLTKCPVFEAEAAWSKYVGDWTMLAMRAVASFSSSSDRTAEDFRAELRAGIQLVLDAMEQIAREEIARNPGATRDEVNARLATVKQKIAAIGWTRLVALGALDGDAPHLISALAQLAGDEIGGSCEGNCVRRQKIAALLSGVAAYALTYDETPAAATAEQKLQLAQAQHDARKQALESVIDAATDRKGRSGDRVWSLGTGVGVLFGARQRLDGESTFTSAVQFHVPVGIAWQRLPGPQWVQNPPFHLMASFLDLGNYLTKNQSTGATPDWQAIFAPGLQIGVPLSTSPSNFFVLGGAVSYAPRFVTTASSTAASSTAQGAWHYGVFVHYFLPLWDFN